MSKKSWANEECPVCQGAGVLPAKRIKPARSAESLAHRRKISPEYTVPGPDTAGVEIALEPNEELSSLLGKWKLIQIRDGHRWSTDDLITAYVAKHAIASPSSHLDLGCGIGSVLSMMLWNFPTLHSVGVEAQAHSAAMAMRSLKFNGCENRATIVDKDFRTFDSQDKFQLVGVFFSFSRKSPLKQTPSLILMNQLFSKIKTKIILSDYRYSSVFWCAARRSRRCASDIWSFAVILAKRSCAI